MIDFPTLNKLGDNPNRGFFRGVKEAWRLGTLGDIGTAVNGIDIFSGRHLTDEEKTWKARRNRVGKGIGIGLGTMVATTSGGWIGLPALNSVFLAWPSSVLSGAVGANLISNNVESKHEKDEYSKNIKGFYQKIKNSLGPNWSNSIHMFSLFGKFSDNRGIELVPTHETGKFLLNEIIFKNQGEDEQSVHRSPMNNGLSIRLEDLSALQLKALHHSNEEVIREILRRPTGTDQEGQGEEQGSNSNSGLDPAVLPQTQPQTQTNTTETYSTNTPTPSSETDKYGVAKVEQPANKTIHDLNVFISNLDTLNVKYGNSTDHKQGLLTLLDYFKQNGVIQKVEADILDKIVSFLREEGKADIIASNNYQLSLKDLDSNKGFSLVDTVSEFIKKMNHSDLEILNGKVKDYIQNELMNEYKSKKELESKNQKNLRLVVEKFNALSVEDRRKVMKILLDPESLEENRQQRFRLLYSNGYYTITDLVGTNFTDNNKIDLNTLKLSIQDHVYLAEWIKKAIKKQKKLHNNSL